MAEVFKRARMVAPCLVVLEDLDSMIDDKCRAFLLNELDGFRPNTGVVVLATTNHPENLDAAILDRPSRFDRKYYFTLPSDAERFSYIRRWNEGLQPEMHINKAVAIEVVERIEGFSFAYLKELLVASMMEWVSGGGSVSMDQVIRTQTELLLSQISKKNKTKAAAG
jgi:AAA+ superfamily predicted ATPase